MRTISTSIFAVILLTLTACCGCNGAKSTNPHTLTGYEWKLYEVAGKRDFAKSESEYYNAVFDKTEGVIRGRAACNSYTIPYTEQDVRKLQLSEGAVTMAMCPDGANEHLYMQTLRSADSYTIDGNMLMLQKGGEVVAIFEAGSKIQ